MRQTDPCASRKNKTRTHQADQEAICRLNDHFRRSLAGGRVMLTSGVLSLSGEAVEAIVFKVRTYADFNADNDPYGEHDFGIVEHGGHRVFFKIDYYARGLEHGSPDPADAEITARVLTIMLASEY